MSRRERRLASRVKDLEIKENGVWGEKSSVELTPTLGSENECKSAAEALASAVDYKISANSEVADLYSLTFEAATPGPNERNILAHHVNCSILGKTLFRDAQINFTSGNRYGLMGPNGRGKSSLLRLVEQRRFPVGSKLQVLLVEQEQEIQALDTPAIEVVLQSDKKRSLYLAEVEELEKKEHPTEEEHRRLLELQEELDAMGTDVAESRARRILYGLGFPAEWQEYPTRQFSGGWRKRISLACAVFMEPDFLMLDEPTNHLDLNAVMWLQTYLPKVYHSAGRNPKTVVVVSHDVEFLDAVCTHMAHIDECKLSVYNGGYYDFVSALQAKRREYDNKYEKVKKEVRAMKKQQHLSQKQVNTIFESRARKTGREVHQVLLERRRDYVVNFPFPDPPPRRDTDCLVRLSEVSFSYPNCPDLFREVSMALWSDSRITVVGPNGVGKTTLLNLIDGTLAPTSGFVERTRNVTIGRYNQHFVDSLPLDKTAVELMFSLGFIHEHEARQRLGSFGLEGVSHHKKLDALSGGQKARVALAAISTQRPHLLLLDEPTNHLDMESINALVEAINRYKGGILVVTHDARLILETDMKLWLVSDKNCTPYKGTLEDYKEYVLELLQEEEEVREKERLRKKELRQSEKNTCAVQNPLGKVKIVDKVTIPAPPEKTKNSSLGSLFKKLDKKKKEKS